MMARLLQKALGSASGRNTDERQEPRVEHCLRVGAKALPQQRALTVDISAGGACLETFAPLEPGLTFDLELEIGVFPLHLKATVLWCESLSRGIYRAGISMAESSPHSLHAYQRYVRNELALCQAKAPEPAL